MFGWHIWTNVELIQLENVLISAEFRSALGQSRALYRLSNESKPSVVQILHLRISSYPSISLSTMVTYDGHDQYQNIDLST